MCLTDAPPSGPVSSGSHPVQDQSASSPYQNVNDFISNVNRFKIIESTLREGEQFANAFFDTETKIRMQCQGSTKVLTHVRCNMEDAKKAVECGVDGVDLVIGTSSFLQKYSHGKSIEMIQKTALEVIEYVKSQGVEVRFSSEDSFRSDLVDLLTLYKAVDKAGVNRVGVADTVGGATPRMVYDLIRTLRETHFHDDTGCAVANAHSALEAGATHIDTSVLGIGERNGITPLGALMARMVVTAPEYVTKKYNLKALKEVEELVASAVNINIPFNNPITGFCAFTHKAGIHAKAILANPSTYEIIDPALFGLTRYISINSRITGWNAIRSRCEQLGIKMTDDEVKEVTAKIKQMADIRPLAIDDTDSILHSYHIELQKKRELEQQA
ncbi:homocitrate synthase, mitochondrial [Trichoderma asperellum]|uniref:Homocitrate synthase, mitochondrial n=1 Tax=Trichoderma asperellum TaxID=101201 RepID=A0A6V8R2T3_TRIAP|nr:homocitrate synthase, mitochondrial [Trichoderma asperellum]